MTREDFRFGVEIECFMHDGVRPRRHDYHSHRESADLSGWRAEYDSSIRSSDEEDETEDNVYMYNQDPIELITCVAGDDEDFNGVDSIARNGLRYGAILDRLERLRVYANLDTNFEEKIAINESCGCHISFSHIGNFSPRELPLQMLSKIKDRFIRKMDEGMLWQQYQKRAFNRQYYRSYAQQIRNEYDHVITAYDRRVEFNIINYRRCEWRSFNLMGMNDFADVVNYIRTAMDSIVEVFIEDDLKYKYEEDIEIEMVGDAHEVMNEQEVSQIEDEYDYLLEFIESPMLGEVVVDVSVRHETINAASSVTSDNQEIPYGEMRQDSHEVISSLVNGGNLRIYRQTEGLLGDEDNVLVDFRR